MIKVVFSLLLCVGIFTALPSKHVRLSKNIGGRIIGGQPANPLQFPFAAAIYVQTSTSRHFCAGTLISNEWILTAGQCVDGATTFQIFLGSIHLSQDPSQLEVATSTYILHPEYDPLTLANDIGLIKLRIAITFTDYIKPILRLPISEIPDFVSVLAFGWGQVNDVDEGLSNQLQWVSVATITNAECQQLYGPAITPNMLCAEGNYNQGTCYGDIGGSLIQYYSTGHAIPVGISSFISSNGCESFNPSGFTRTYPYNAWIRNTTGLSLQ